MRTTNLDFKVQLDDQNLPIKMDWDATDSPIEGRKECKAVMTSIWDGATKKTLKIDLWTKEMRIDEMNFFFFQSFITMADTYMRATNDPAMAQQIRDFGETFGKQTKVIE